MEHDSFLNQIRKNWILLAFIVTLIVTWTTFNSRLASAEQKITDLQSLVNQINQININIAVIQERVTNIDRKLNGTQ